MPRNFEAANRAFDERIRAKFPAGSSEALLRDELTAEHFKIVATPLSPPPTYQFTAVRGGSIFPACDLTWTVLWSADGGRITKIAATYYATCL